MAVMVDPVLTTAEAAAFAKVSTKTIYRAINSGALVANAPGAGRRYRITRESFLDWFEAKRSMEPRVRLAPVASPGTSKATKARLRAIEDGIA